MNAETKISAHPPAPDWVELVREKVESLRFGVVQLVVHDGRVTQIERTEKTRLPAVRDDLPGN
ncbi:MAG TPA: YezD family protein [Opitutaceae bacterium]|nr:YezD family protein [Opitutaceae bacterium]